MLLLLDNYDSFTYNLVDYFEQLGEEVLVFRNDVPLERLEQHPYDAVVLSPGPGAPRQAGILMQVIERYHRQLPMLGICLGHQALGEFFGAKLTKGLRPMHGKISEIQTENEAFFRNLPRKLNVVRYHSLVLQNLPADLIPLAYTAENELMALRHRHLPLFGLQFHPEAILTECGLEMLANWLREVKKTEA